MSNDKLQISKLKDEFYAKSVITINDINSFYRKNEPDILRNTVSWRIFTLVEQGILQRIGRGKYRVGKTQEFVPLISAEMKNIQNYIVDKFPFTRYCLWEMNNVNYFSQHLINFNVTFLDVERDAMNVVYFELKEHFSRVMLLQNLYDELFDFDNAIIIRPLVTDAPIRKIDGIYIITVEKLLVDLFSDKEFISFQGNEIHTIFSTAFEKFTINQQRMLRYAGRKNKRKQIEKIIKTINRQ